MDARQSGFDCRAISSWTGEGLVVIVSNSPLWLAAFPASSCERMTLSTVVGGHWPSCDVMDRRWIPQQSGISDRHNLLTIMPFDGR